MLTGVTNLRSLVASKARLNAALQRQSCDMILTSTIFHRLAVTDRHG
jgi:hypothetical protein